MRSFTLATAFMVFVVGVARADQPKMREALQELRAARQELASWQEHMLAAWARIWAQYFPGGKPSQRRRSLMYYTVSVLTGLAATQMLSGRSVGRLETELGYLKDTLVRELARGGK